MSTYIIQCLKTKINQHGRFCRAVIHPQRRNLHLFDKRNSTCTSAPSPGSAHSYLAAPRQLSTCSNVTNSRYGRFIDYYSQKRTRHASMSPCFSFPSIRSWSGWTNKNNCDRAKFSTCTQCTSMKGTMLRECVCTYSSLRMIAPHCNAVRHYASKKRKQGKQSSQDDSDSDTDEEVDLTGFEETDHHDEDKDFPKNFRTLQVSVKSLRVDTILASGLNISRSKIEDYFLGSKLRVNGEKCLKKSKKIGAGDALDLVMETSDSIMKVKRVRILAVSEERTKSERCKVLVKAWRSTVPIEAPKKEF